MRTKIFSSPLIYIMSVAGILTFVSCKKAVELEPIGYVTQDSVVRNDADFYGLLNSGYFALAQDDYYGGSIQVYSDLLADHLDGSTLNGDYLSAYNHNTNIFNPGISSMYGQMNKPILQANTVLQNLSKASAGEKNRIEGTARFLRALCQFDLVRLWAQPYKMNDANNQQGIPLRLVPDRIPNQRSTVAEVYAQVIADLKKADTLLPATNTVYATSWSAKALLARVYFQMNDFENAYAYANDVIENGGFGFDTNFTSRYSSAGTPEAIFYLIYEANNTQGRFQRLLGSYRTTGTALPGLKLTNTIYQKANVVQTDARKIWYKQNSGFNLLAKFDSQSVKLPVILITELKLIRAEAAAELNQNLPVAIQDLNDIMERAYGAGSSLLLPATANVTLIKATARRERELEFVGEGNRLQELKREASKGESVTIRGSVYNCPGMIFPFPTNEVNFNSLEQNPIGGCN